MEKEYYINIQSWMVQNLKLSGNELLTYAIVYGFSQDGESTFLGSSKYVAYALGVSRTTAIKALDALTAKGLIIKTQDKINDVVFNRYKVSLQAIKNLDTPYKESVQGGYTETVQGGYTESVHSNKYKELNNKNNKKKESKKASYDEQIAAYTENEELQKALKAFIQMRSMIKKPLTDYAMRLMLNNLSKLASDDNTKIAILNQSIMHNWQGVFPLKNGYTEPQKQQEEPKQQEQVIKPVDYRDYLTNAGFDAEGYNRAQAEYRKAMERMIDDGN